MESKGPPVFFVAQLFPNIFPGRVVMLKSRMWWMPMTMMQRFIGRLEGKSL